MSATGSVFMASLRRFHIHPRQTNHITRARCSDDWTMVSPDAMVFIARKVDGSSPQPPVSGVRIAGCGEPVR